MNLAKVPERKKVLADAIPSPKITGRTLNGRKALVAAPARLQVVRVALSRDDVEKDLGRFLDGRTHRQEHSVLGSGELLARYNRSRRERGLNEISQRRLGDAMAALGYRDKARLAGRIHYRGLAWSPDSLGVAAATSIDCERTMSA